MVTVTREILAISNPSFRNIPDTTVEDTARRSRRRRVVRRRVVRRPRRPTIAQIRAAQAASRRRGAVIVARQRAAAAAKQRRLAAVRAANLVRNVTTTRITTATKPGASQSALRQAAQRGQTAVVQATAGRRGRKVTTKTPTVSTRRGRLSDLSNEDAVRTLKFRFSRARNVAQRNKIRRQAAARGFTFPTPKPKPRRKRTRARSRPGFSTRRNVRTGRVTRRRVSRRRRARRTRRGRRR